MKLRVPDCVHLVCLLMVGVCKNENDWTSPIVKLKQASYLHWNNSRLKYWYIKVQSLPFVASMVLLSNARLAPSQVCVDGMCMSGQINTIISDFHQYLTAYSRFDYFTFLSLFFFFLRVVFFSLLLKISNKYYALYILHQEKPLDKINKKAQTLKWIRCNIHMEDNIYNIKHFFSKSILPPI